MPITLTGIDVRGVLLDIEGTITPIAFVHDVLFPYARSHVGKYLAAHSNSPEVTTDLVRLREEHSADVAHNLNPPPLTQEIDSNVAYIHWLIDRDRKSTGLKSLQGKIWEEGYLDGKLKAPLFEDVAPAIKRWREAGCSVSIFSSGSIMAQRLLFAHTGEGDLTNLIDNYFDTTTGPKTAEASYKTIASSLDLPASKILFISDVTPELDAASAAGMQTLLCVRPGNMSQPEEHRYQVIRDFNRINN